MSRDRERNQCVMAEMEDTQRKAECLRRKHSTLFIIRPKMGKRAFDQEGDAGKYLSDVIH